MKLLSTLVVVAAAAGCASAFYGPTFPSGPIDTYVHERPYAAPYPEPYPVVQNVPVERFVHRTLVKNVPHPVPVVDPVPVPVPVPRVRPVPVPVPVPRVRPVPVQSNHFHYRQLNVPLPY
ncbi:cyclin-dependent kinase inhibitor 1C-like [Amphibalanus amphitrite]|uniref:cyclin-dependent kinase inhibitor 1C-like n=1 Tax=Amphibalanus amphitrite TaxID=1232801 RepID=UPI001C914467|nr:cyclin-dependent kinase inhibitor 1C-like [Amphibalanus amphitrite]